MRRVAVAVAAVAVALAGGCTESGGPASSGASRGDSPSGLGALFSVPAWSSAFSLLPVDGESLRMTTSIGVLEWTTYAVPEGREFSSPLATEHGPVALSASAAPTERPRFLWSQDSVAWDGVESGMEVGHLVRAGEDVVLYRTRGTVTPRTAEVDAVRYSWDGSGWVRSAELEVPGPLLGLAYGPEEAVATYDSVDGVLFAHSSDGVNFAAVDGPAAEDLKGDDCGYAYSGSGPQVLATRNGFVAMTPSNRMDWGDQVLCEPVTWTSADGTAWTLRTPKSPFEDGVVVDAVAERAGRFVAVGRAGEPGDWSAWTSGAAVWSAWTSGDAVVWEPIGVDLDVGPLTVSSGPLGWIITGGHYTAEGVVEGVEVFMWTSPDGVTWDGPHALPNGLVTGYYFLDLTVGTDAVFGIGDRGPTPVVARVVS